MSPLAARTVGALVGSSVTSVRPAMVVGQPQEAPGSWAWPGAAAPRAKAAVSASWEKRFEFIRKRVWGWLIAFAARAVQTSSAGPCRELWIGYPLITIRGGYHTPTSTDHEAARLG